MQTKIDIRYSKIQFGLYPQGLLEDNNIINELNKKVGEFKKDKWTSFEYYNDNIRSDYMYYYDITHNGIKYRGVYMQEYRPHDLSQNHDDIGIGNIYKTNRIYWFIYEKVEWLVLEEKDDSIILLADKSLDSTHYYGPYKENDDEIKTEHNGGLGYLSNYKLSSIRLWLNDYFYNMAFNNEEKNIILDTNINNKLDDDLKEYECLDTIDKVYLLSKEEILKYFPSERKSRTYPTKYNEINSNCLSTFYYWYWLRTPYDSFHVNISDIGHVNKNDEMVYISKFYIDCAHVGIRPVIRIKKDNLEYKLPEIVVYTINRK